MTTVREIITAGYRESNFKAQVSTLTTEEETEALGLLKSITSGFFGQVVGTKPRHWYLPNPQINSSIQANYPAMPGLREDRGSVDLKNPPPNTRMFVKNTSPETVYFQYHPEDGAMMQYVDTGHTADVTFDANGMLFGQVTDVATQQVVTARYPSNGRNASKAWVFRADLGAWLEVETLVLANEFPFPAEFDDYFITAMAIRLAPRFGNEPTQATMMRYKDMLVYCRGQYRQTSETVVGNAGVPTHHSYNSRTVIENGDTGY